MWLCPPRRPGGRGKGEPRPKAVNARYLSVGWGKMYACQTSGSVVKTVVPILLVKLQKQARSVRKIHVDYWGSTPRSHVAAMYLHLFAYSLERKCSVKVPKSTHTRTHDRRPTRNAQLLVDCFSTLGMFSARLTVKRTSQMHRARLQYTKRRPTSNPSKSST